MPILLFYLLLTTIVSMNLDRLILDCSQHGVNPEIFAARRGPQPAAHSPPPGGGGTVRCRTSGGPFQGPEPDFDAPRPAQTGRSGGRPAYGKELFLPPEGP